MNSVGYISASFPAVKKEGTKLQYMCFSPCNFSHSRAVCQQKLEIRIPKATGPPNAPSVRDLILFWVLLITAIQLHHQTLQAPSVLQKLEYVDVDLACE